MSARSMARYAPTLTDAPASTCAAHGEQARIMAGAERATCSQCECTLHAAYVTRQPTLGGMQLCGACIDERNAAADQERKQARAAGLASLPACRVHTCTRKARQIVRDGSGDGVALCSQHARNLQRAHRQRMARVGGIGLFLPPTYGTDTLLDMAESGR